MSFEDQVRERAYQIWLAGGMADGLAHEHWTMAEAAVKAAKPVVILTKAAKTPAAKGKGAAKAASTKAKTTGTGKTASKPTAKTASRKAAKPEATAAH